jgi:hypothetical protein
VSAGEDDERLRIADTVLYDLAFGGGITGGVGVMRRPAEEAPAERFDNRILCRRVTRLGLCSGAER